jgi:hypothetical protein
LHDCGKLTTPVHVVDKATKLQTIFDRIELVTARFEVAKRDATIATLQAKLALARPVDDPHTRSAMAALDGELASTLAQLNAD